MIPFNETDIVTRLSLLLNASSFSVCEQVDAIAHDSEYMLDHPMVRPLTDLVRHELNVMRAAGRGLQSAKCGQHESIVVCLLELRTAINAWVAADEGEVCVL